MLVVQVRVWEKFSPFATCHHLTRALKCKIGLKKLVIEAKVRELALEARVAMHSIKVMQTSLYKFFL